MTASATHPTTSTLTGRRLWLTIVPIAVAPTLVAIVSLISDYAMAGSMPDPMATHWGANDAPDGSMSVAGALGFSWLMTAIILVSCLGMTWFAVTRGQAALTRRMSAATAGFLAAILGAVNVGTFAVQIDAPDWHAAGSVNGWMLGGVGVGLVLAVIGWFAIPGDPQDLPDEPVASGPRVHLTRTERATWSARVSNHMPLILVGVIAVIATVSLILSNTPVAAILGLIALMGVLEVLATVFSQATVTVDIRGLTVRGGLGLRMQHVPLSDVVLAEEVRVSPVREFGGWGVRVDRHGRTGVVMSTGPGLQVTRRGGAKFVVTVPKARQGAALLNTLAERARRK